MKELVRRSLRLHGPLRIGMGRQDRRVVLSVLTNREEFTITNAFVEMVENVSRLIDGEDCWIVSAADSIRVAQILDTIAATTL